MYAGRLPLTIGEADRNVFASWDYRTGAKVSSRNGATVHMYTSIPAFEQRDLLESTQKGGSDDLSRFLFILLLSFENFTFCYLLYFLSKRLLLLLLLFHDTFL